VKGAEDQVVTTGLSTLLTAAIWHNRHTAQPITRSLTAYDH
jgi:hypothetical protein